MMGKTVRRMTIVMAVAGIAAVPAVAYADVYTDVEVAQAGYDSALAERDSLVAPVVEAGEMEKDAAKAEHDAYSAAVAPSSGFNRFFEQRSADRGFADSTVEAPALILLGAFDDSQADLDSARKAHAEAVEDLHGAAQNLADAQRRVSDASSALDEAVAARDREEARIEAERREKRDSFIASGVDSSQVDALGMQDWASDKVDFAMEWQPRIDAYLAGSPLSGYGIVFASAAYDCGVDPRWSPAISCIESGKGSVCFRSHNAWGWGGSGWSDWNTAIYAHVSGLASGYGCTISEAAAQKYCPPTWQSWYSGVSGEMAKI